MPNDFIKISRTSAIFLIDFAKKLWLDGYGTSFDQEDPEMHMETVGYIDEIDLQNPDLLIWANALLSFARHVARLAQHGLENEELWDSEDGI